MVTCMLTDSNLKHNGSQNMQHIMPHFCNEYIPQLINRKSIQEKCYKLVFLVYWWNIASMWARKIKTSRNLEEICVKVKKKQKKNPVIFFCSRIDACVDLSVCVIFSSSVRDGCIG